MSNPPSRHYRQGTGEACRLHENLGYGIGCFQGLSNFAVNGEWIKDLMVLGVSEFFLPLYGVLPKENLLF